MNSSVDKDSESYGYWASEADGRTSDTGWRSHEDDEFDDGAAEDDEDEESESEEGCSFGDMFVSDSKAAVEVGSIVTIEFAHEEVLRFHLYNRPTNFEDDVLPTVLPESPIGVAVIGARAGDFRSYTTPNGIVIHLRVRDVEGGTTESQQSTTVSPFRNSHPTIRSTPAIGNSASSPAITTHLENLPQLSRQQIDALISIEAGVQHIFVTGTAGTGKSLVLKHLAARSNNQIPITAPTGIAAINVGGETIHSFFSLPIGVIAEEKLGSLREEKRTYFAR